MTKENHTGLKSKGMILLTAIIWGAGFIVSQMALDAKLSAAAILLGRFSIAALLIFIVFSKDILKNFKIKHIKNGIIIGVFLFSAFFLQTTGLQYSTPSNNALITSANVVMVPFLWWAVSRKKPARIIFSASALCLIGVWILSVDFSSGLSLGLGDFLTLMCAVLFACQITATGVLTAKMDYKVLLFLQFAAASLCALAAFLFLDRDFTIFIQPDALFPLLYLGIFSTCICYFLQTKAQTRVSSSTAAILLSTEALSGSFFSVLAGYDALSPKLIAGGLIIFLSVILPDVYAKISE